MFIGIFLASVYLSLYFKFYSLRNVKKGFIYLFDNDGEGEISPISSLSTSLAACLGTGNIVGVGSAIALGGPGAIFWMWITAMFGSILQFSEGALSKRFSRKINDEYCGGPMLYLEKITKIGKPMALIYSILIILASLIIGNMIQVSSIVKTSSIKYIGIGIFILVSISIIGGIKQIGAVCGKIIPLITYIFIIISVIVIINNYESIIPSFKLIISDAFTGKAAQGGLFGGTIKYGISRGIFTSEAGLGSGGIAYGASKNKYCYRVGLIASLGVIFDTIIMCSLTAFVILTSGININENPNMLAQMAFAKSLGFFGSGSIQVLMFVYALSTIIGWYYFGLIGFKYLFKRDDFFKYFYLAFILIGIIINNSIIWELVDIINILLAIINLLGLFLLRKNIKEIIDKKE